MPSMKCREGLLLNLMKMRNHEYYFEQLEGGANMGEKEARFPNKWQKTLATRKFGLINSKLWQ